MAARMAIMTSQLVGSLVVAPAIRSSADWGLSIGWLTTCAHPSVMTWLGWPGRLWHFAAYFTGDRKMVEPYVPDRGKSGGRAAMAATVETVV